MLFYCLLPAFPPCSGAGMDVQPQQDMGTLRVSCGMLCRPWGKTFLQKNNHAVIWRLPSKCPGGEPPQPTQEKGFSIAPWRLFPFQSLS